MNALTEIREQVREMDDFTIEDLTDSYKDSHWRQRPPGTDALFFFQESRVGAKFSTTTYFGLNYYLKRYLSGPIVTAENILEAKENSALHFGDPTIFNEAGWYRILDVHKGHLPVRIRAVPEGTTVPIGNALMVMESTDSEANFVPGHLETITSMPWYPSTVCTQSREMRKVILRYLEETGDPSLIDFKLHDFGFRGSTSPESAGIGGMAHLVSFNGTDNKQALRFARKYYNERMAGFSIPAAEHSTITPWLKEHEVNAYANMLDQFPSGLVAVVSDSWDVFHACRELWGNQLRTKVLSRDGTLVVRPDSGPPPETVLRVLNILGEAFGYEVNAKGYKVLDPHVRIIQGDGIDYEMLSEILEVVKQAKWSADNIAFGSGGGLLQKMDRDTQKFAIKCSAAQVNGIWRDVRKEPITDPKKWSKAGRLALVKDASGNLKTVREEEAKGVNLLVPIFENGRLLADQTFAEIRRRARA